jgi:ubiquinol-cytochrome c reductase cytochrome b subunit
MHKFNNILYHNIHRSFYVGNLPFIITEGSRNLSTLALNPYHNMDISFNEWLAGIIDGDGHFRLSNGKYPHLKIEMETKNTMLLSIIQVKFGGVLVSPYPSRPTVARYTIGNRKNMVYLVNCINGQIRNSVRVSQFIKICEVLDIQYIPAIPLTRESAWFTGFFDADGSIVAGLTKKYPYISIKATNMTSIDLEPFLIFGGSINKSGANCWDWIITHPTNIRYMVYYFSKYPSLSHKRYRI